jgi:hypothetical protein
MANKEETHEGSAPSFGGGFASSGVASVMSCEINNFDGKHIHTACEYDGDEEEMGTFLSYGGTTGAEGQLMTRSVDNPAGADKSSALVDEQIGMVGVSYYY